MTPDARGCKPGRDDDATEVDLSESCFESEMEARLKAQRRALNRAEARS
jgi:hypothetical protein